MERLRANIHRRLIEINKPFFQEQLNFKMTSLKRALFLVIYFILSKTYPYTLNRKNGITINNALFKGDINEF